jgi:hypothetical protein
MFSLWQQTDAAKLRNAGYGLQTCRKFDRCAMTTNRRWLQSLIEAALPENTPALPWAAPARSTSARLADTK